MESDEARSLHSEADTLIRAMYTGQTPWSARERVYSLKLRAAFATVRQDEGATIALNRLVYGLAKPHCFLTLEPLLSTIGPQAGNTGIDILLHLARYHSHWLQYLEDWRPESDDPCQQMFSLTRYLFALYLPPRFLDSAWVGGFSEDSEIYRRWFVHLAQGKKLEALRFPLPLTHRAAHHFLNAPDDFSIVSAMRYGQIKALGGSDGLPRVLSETFLSERQADEAFYLSVVTFLVNHPELPLSQIGPLLDFIRFRKFGSHGDDGPEPNFTLKGRTVEALLRRMEEWYETLARLGKKARQSWDATGIPPLDVTEKDSLSSATCRWRIVEITDTLSLAEEGREMRHCVRSYGDACFKGEKSIWSLRLTLSDNPVMRRLLTIEVNNHRRSIVQVRGKCNQPLTSMRGNRRMMLARDVLKSWANQRHLGIGCSI